MKLIETLKNIWGSNSSSSYKAGAWIVAGIAFYASTKIFDDRKLTQKHIEQHNKNILDKKQEK